MSSLRLPPCVAIPALLSLHLAACGTPDFVVRPADAASASDAVLADAATTPDRPLGADAAVDATTRDGGAVGDAVTADDTAATGDDAGPPADVGPTMPGTVPASIARALPAFDDPTLARVRGLRTAGLAAGNRPDVFAKIGDSITEAGGFLQDIGDGYYDLQDYAWLMPTLTYFDRVHFADARSSFNRYSTAAMGGWVSAQVLAGDPASPLQNEIAAIHPLYAIVMIGTNDLDRDNLPEYTANLARIATILEGNGTVPIFSTIPDRTDPGGPAARVASYNTAVRSLAASHHVPLIDYWLVMHDLPGDGISDDGIHPSIWRNMGDPQATDFRAEALQYGYNMRNLTALLMLDRLRNLAP